MQIIQQVLVGAFRSLLDKEVHLAVIEVLDGKVEADLDEAVVDDLVNAAAAACPASSRNIKLSKAGLACGKARMGLFTEDVFQSDQLAL